MIFIDKWLILSFSNVLFQSFPEMVSQSKLQPSWYWRPFQTILFQQPLLHWRTFTLWCLTVRALGFICRKWPRWMSSDDCTVGSFVGSLHSLDASLFYRVLCRPFFYGKLNWQMLASRLTAEFRLVFQLTCCLIKDAVVIWVSEQIWKVYKKGICEWRTICVYVTLLPSWHSFRVSQVRLFHFCS